MMKTDINPDGAHRPGWPGGIAEAECEGLSTSCADTDAFSPSQPELLFYQVLAACGPTGDLEGPVF
jgi:hypothetical protein